MSFNPDDYIDTFRETMRRKRPRRPMTSKSHPLRVDWVAQEAHGLPGKLGMTIAPGKQADGWTGLWDRSLDADLRVLRDVHRVRHIVSLMERFEYENCNMVDLFDHAPKYYGISVDWHPVVDMNVPKNERSYRLHIGRTMEKLRKGQNVLVHCRGGLGRTGTYVACLLVENGMAPQRAILATRAARKGTIERGRQVDYVRNWRSEADGCP